MIALLLTVLLLTGCSAFNAERDKFVRDHSGPVAQDKAEQVYRAHGKERKADAAEEALRVFEQQWDVKIRVWGPILAMLLGGGKALEWRQRMKRAENGGAHK